jgi:hypothetical protein
MAHGDNELGNENPEKAVDFQEISNLINAAVIKYDINPENLKIEMLKGKIWVVQDTGPYSLTLLYPQPE